MKDLKSDSTKDNLIDSANRLHMTFRKITILDKGPVKGKGEDDEEQIKKKGFLTLNIAKP